MSHIHRHPAPGLGELIPGWWNVPNNPFNQPTVKSVRPSVGELVRTNWVLPQNPLANSLSTVGLPAGQKSGRGVLQGLGQININEFLQDWADPSSWTLGQWALVVGIGAVLLVTMRKDSSAYRAAKLQAKADYHRAIAEAKSKSPTLAYRAYEAYQRRGAAPAAPAAAPPKQAEARA